MSALAINPVMLSFVFLPVKHRYENIKCSFVKTYGKQPLFCGRAPGRVNLIGMCVFLSVMQQLLDYYDIIRYI